HCVQHLSTECARITIGIRAGTPVYVSELQGGIF
ncbi:hypothetical protein A2U01_0090302, partial [Trifolium medium]|nr:hypothetical protein [Trifolium medium]